MAIDLTQFHPVFFEESLEGLEAMEAALLALDPDAVDQATINELFRAAHSIKGGSGTFGFAAVADFTHGVETLLEQVRSGKRRFSVALVEVLLQAVDCTRQMIRQLQRKNTAPIPELATTRQRLDALLASADVAVVTPEPAPGERQPPSVTPAACAGWQIEFVPGPTILRTGNDPLRLFRELATLGDLKVKLNPVELPSIKTFDPESLCLGWTLTLDSPCDAAQVAEVFDWVAQESHLRITPRTASPAQSATDSDATPDLAAAAGKPEQTEKPEKAEKAEKAEKGEPGSIRVGIRKVDDFVDMVGELAITQSMLCELGNDFTLDKLPRLLQGLESLAQNTRELQAAALAMRMLPMGFVFNRFTRLVHDLGQTTGKKVRLNLLGEGTELDKLVMEKINDPLGHLIRNAIDHGIEQPQVRRQAGKPETGTVTLNAFHQGGNIIIQVQDDGVGLDCEKIRTKAIERGLLAASDSPGQGQLIDLIFHPGFSTAAQVSDISGRGVGMDVVRCNIQALNGSVDVSSVAGQGVTFSIRLPLTLAMLEGQLVRLGSQVFVLPLMSVVESLRAVSGPLRRVAGDFDVVSIAGEYVPVVRLCELFQIAPDSQGVVDTVLVVVEGDNVKAAILVDDVLTQQPVVIKSLEAHYRKVEGIGGATILGDGSVALILDVAGLLQLAGIRRDLFSRINANKEHAA